MQLITAQHSWFLALAVERYVSPQEMARRAADAALAEQTRRNAETDGAKQRALRDMMNGTLESKKTSRAEALLVSTSCVQ